MVATNTATVEALRKFETLDVPYNEAVEAEALAQLLDKENSPDTIDVLAQAYVVHDVDQMESRLDADGRLGRIPIPPQKSDGEDKDEPPPRAGSKVGEEPDVRAGTADDRPSPRAEQPRPDDSGDEPQYLADSVGVRPTYPSNRWHRSEACWADRAMSRTLSSTSAGH